MEDKISISLRFGENRSNNEKFLQAIKDGYVPIEEWFDPMTQGTRILMEKK